MNIREGISRLQHALSEPGGESLKADTSLDQDADTSLAQDPELLADFVLESREHLAGIEEQVLILEQNPADLEALHSIFRGFHTIKGLAGFLELWEVQKISHEVETVLDMARNSRLRINPPAIDIILKSADYLRRWLAYIESRLGGEILQPPSRDEALLGRICELYSVASDTDNGADAILTMAAAVEAGESAPAADSSANTGAVATRTGSMAVKVDTSKLDALVDIAGELVIAESLVRHDPELGAIRSPMLQRKMAQLARIAAELQKTAMVMRLVPIGPLFRRMTRLVRDLARQFGKRVDLETQGDEIELDRTIVEELADPLMHMVRNALDHGIETPKERQERGKSPNARLLLKAQHQAGQIVIEIADDGRGLDRERIVRKAVDRGLVVSAAALSDSEVFNLIFVPGFSTVSQVTNVSGRGVGMDVVRRHIEKLRGRIEIRSAAGCGATFLLKLPLTLAMIDGLVVSVGQERYILPLFAVREIFRPQADTIWTVQHRGEMALVREKLLPVLRLYRRFQLQPKSEDPTQSIVVVSEVDGQRFCLLVDELIGRQEVMIKSLGSTFQHVSGVAGGAILGDGKVGLVLDLDRLFQDRPGEAVR
jgi:two-component system chemotaxis sensor kinase CheA